MATLLQCPLLPNEACMPFLSRSLRLFALLIVCALTGCNSLVLRPDDSTARSTGKIVIRGVCSYQHSVRAKGALAVTEIPFRSQTVIKPVSSYRKQTS